MASTWEGSDYYAIRDMISSILGMLQQSAESFSYYEPVREVKEKYEVENIFKCYMGKRPVSFVNPVNQLKVEFNVDHRSVLINVRDGSFLAPDCHMSYYRIAIGSTQIPLKRLKPDQKRQFWYNHVDGELTSLIVFQLPEMKIVSYGKKDGVGAWQLDYNQTDYRRLPKKLERCKKLLGQPIPFQVDVKTQFDDFMQKSGLLDLCKDLLAAWPCAKCRKPKKNHRGNAINGYEPMALS